VEGRAVRRIERVQIEVGVFPTVIVPFKEVVTVASEVIVGSV
jgi:hypothetical protein